MCGIVGGVGEPDRRGLDAIEHRGPDYQGAVQAGPWWIGHTRLSILDLDPRSNQPFIRGKVSLAFNGEIWNYRELRSELEQAGEAFTTSGDTEVVAAALDRWGSDALRKLNGMFAVVWYDGECLQLARDRYGEIPLHFHNARAFAFASELKAFEAMGCDRRAYRWVEPGEVVEVRLTGPLAGVRRRPYHEQVCAPGDATDAPARMRALIDAGATERAISDVPVCALLSGGIDSSAIVYHLRNAIPNLVCYTAVMDPRSPDLKQARAVAAALQVELREVSVTPPTASDLEEVIRVIEMPHKAQIEIGWACLQLAERMHDDGFRVTFSGEGADELMGSYGFVDHAIRAGEDFHEVRKRLVLTQHRKNFARCNKVFMQHGVECRLPFLHPPLVDYALSLPLSAVRSTTRTSKRKMPITDGYVGALPEAVVSRAKLAFQGGLGLKQDISDRLADPMRLYRTSAHKQYGKNL